MEAPRAYDQNAPPQQYSAMRSPMPTNLPQAPMAEPDSHNRRTEAMQQMRSSISRPLASSHIPRCLQPEGVNSGAGYSQITQKEWVRRNITEFMGSLGLLIMAHEIADKRERQCGYGSLSSHKRLTLRIGDQVLPIIDIVYEGGKAGESHLKENIAYYSANFWLAFGLLQSFILAVQVEVDEQNRVEANTQPPHYTGQDPDAGGRHDHPSSNLDLRIDSSHGQQYLASPMNFPPSQHGVPQPPNPFRTLTPSQAWQLPTHQTSVNRQKNFAPHVPMPQQATTQWYTDPQLSAEHFGPPANHPPPQSWNPSHFGASPSQHVQRSGKRPQRVSSSTGSAALSRNHVWVSPDSPTYSDVDRFIETVRRQDFYRPDRSKRSQRTRHPRTPSLSESSPFDWSSSSERSSSPITSPPPSPPPTGRFNIRHEKVPQKSGGGTHKHAENADDSDDSNKGFVRKVVKGLKEVLNEGSEWLPKLAVVTESLVTIFKNGRIIAELVS